MNTFKRWAVSAAKSVLERYSFNVDGTGYRGMGGGTYAGMNVDRVRALQSSTFYQCMTLIGGVIPTLGIDIYREKKSGSREVASAHPLHEVLRYEPDEHHTGVEFWQKSIWDQELSGNAYSKITRNSSDQITGFVSWDPERVELDTETDSWKYKYTNSRGKQTELSEWTAGGLCNVLHLRNFSSDGIKGISTVGLANQRLGLDLAVEKYGASFFGRGGRVKDIFKIDAPNITKAQRDEFRLMFQESYGHNDAFHSVLALERGMSYEGKSGATPNEAQFLETQIQNSIAICRFLGVPPTLVGILDRATYNNQEQLVIQFLTFALSPRVERIEQACRRALLTPQEKRLGYFIHSKIQKILRGDQKARSEYYRTMQSLGNMNQNEVRELEDMPMIEDPSANEYRQAQNIFGPPAGTPDAGTDQGTPTEEPTAA